MLRHRLRFGPYALLRFHIGQRVILSDGASSGSVSKSLQSGPGRNEAVNRI